MKRNLISRVAAFALVVLTGCAGEPSTGASAPETAARSFQVGESFVYEVKSERTVSMGNFRSAFEGTLAITVVGEDASGAHELRGDIRSARYEQSPAEDVTEELSKPFFFTVEPSGAVKSFRFSRGVSAGAAAVQRELALSLQLSRPEGQDPSAAEWHVVERDSTGRYDASYSQSGGVVHKSKDAYLPGGADGAGSPIQGVSRLSVRSSADFTLDESAWPRTVTEQESATAQVGEIVVTSTKASSAKLVAVETAPELVGAVSPADLVPDTAIDAAGRALARIQADQNRVNGQSFEQIASDLASEDPMVRNHAQGRLVALVRLDSAAARAASAEVLRDRADVNAKKRLIGALGAAGTDAAQHELVRLLAVSEDLGVSRSIDVIVALALTRAPTQEAALALAEKVESADKGISSTAILASGAMVRAMRLNGSGDTGPAMDRLLRGLREAESSGRRVLFLEALGNTGDARAMEAISRYLDDEDVQVRAAAVHGMRFMAGEDADSAVVRGMADPEPEVQKAAARTLAHRPIGPVLAAVDALLASATDKNVRTAALEGLRAKKHELDGLSASGATEAQRQLARGLLNAR